MYEKYKTIKSSEEFWQTWTKEEIDNLNPELTEYIYKRYFTKCLVFQRDDFKCQNENCKTPKSRITFHHIKHQRNNGKDSLRNCITICKICHNKFNKAKAGLTFLGMTYKLDKQKQGFDWKAYKVKAKVIRKNNKKEHGIIISWQLLKILIKFLEKEYSDIFEDD